MSAKPNAPAAERNKNAILEVIRDEFRNCESILEIGSGTGQHAIFFASKMPWLIWQTSDLPVNHDGICGWLQSSDLDNVKAPLALDVEQPLPVNDRFDGVFSANTAHIMSFKAVECMIDKVAQCLIDGGKFCLYGPFRLKGEFTSDSNMQFDANLKMQDTQMGLRNLEDLDGIAAKHSLHRDKLYAMPANNMIAVWTRNECDKTERGHDHT